MSTHSPNLTTNKDEENIERILDDLRRNTRTDVAAAGEINPRAIAAQAVKKYWADREQGIIDREGDPIDDNEGMLHRLARRRMISPQQEFAAAALFTLGPLLLIIIVMWFSPSLLKVNKETLYSDKIIIAIAALLALLSLLVSSFALRANRREPDGLRLGTGASPHSMVYLTVGFAGASLIALFLGYALQKEEASLRAEKETTQTLAQERLIDITRSKIEQLESPDFDNSSPPPEETVQLSNKKSMKIVSKPVVRGKKELKYEVSSEELAAPLQIRIDKNSGEMSVLRDGKPEATTIFYVGVVESASDSSLNLKVEGREGSISLPLSNLVPKPSPGQKVFVAFDLKSKSTTDITVMNKKAGEPEDSGN
jgi:hypothetical protein